MTIPFPGQFSPVPGSFQAIPLTSTAETLDLPTASNGVPKYALIQVLGDPVNWRDDGVNPTALANGGMFLLAAAGAVGFLGNLATASFISTGSSTLLVSYYS